MKLVTERNWTPGFLAGSERLRIAGYEAAIDDTGKWVVKLDGHRIAGARTHQEDLESARARAEAVIAHRHQIEEAAATNG